MVWSRCLCLRIWSATFPSDIVSFVLTVEELNSPNSLFCLSVYALYALKPSFETVPLFKNRMEEGNVPRNVDAEDIADVVINREAVFFAVYLTSTKIISGIKTVFFIRNSEENTQAKFPLCPAALPT